MIYQTNINQIKSVVMSNGKYTNKQVKKIHQQLDSEASLEMVSYLPKFKTYKKESKKGYSKKAFRQSL